MSWVYVIKQALPEAVDLIKALIKAGKDPVVEIRRIRNSVEQREAAGTEQAWDAAIESKPDRHDTQPSMPAFDYDDIDTSDLDD